MSSYLAIRGVTETLRSLLDKMMDTEVTISAGPPDLKPESDQNEKRISLYLYKVVENPYLKNQEIPGEGHPAAYGHPPLSLVLYYLLTAFPPAIDTYNEDYDLEAHEILGHAMQVFHDYPVLTDSMEVPPGSGTKLLHSSLLNQFEKVKITLEPLNTEELTKIWMGLNTAYRLSVGYMVSVVQIESQKPRRIARPVKTRQVHLMQLRRPQIEDISTRDTANLITVMPPATARIGDELTIKGVNFLGLSTQVILGNVKIPVTPDTESLIKLTIPDNSDLQPGALTIGVTVEIATEAVKGGYYDCGETASDKNFVTSNQMALMLLPKITSTNGTATTLTVKGERLFKEGLKTFVLVGDVAIEVKKPGATATEVQVPLEALSGLPRGNYPVRVRVNGAESLEEDKEFELI